VALIVSRIAGVHLIAGEVLTVAQTLGVQVEPVGEIPAQAFLDGARGVGLEDLRAWWVEREKSVGAGRPSLLQDILEGRPTEGRSSRIGPRGGYSRRQP